MKIYLMKLISSDENKNQFESSIKIQFSKNQKNF